VWLILGAMQKTTGVRVSYFLFSEHNVVSFMYMYTFSAVTVIAVICAGTSELPLLDYPLRQLFHLLGVQSILDIFTGVLLEQQILFYSCGQ